MADLIAKFNKSVNAGTAPLVVNFTNISTGPYNRVLWDFGDGSTSTEINPSHQYLTSGVYQITLKVYDLAGNESSTNSSLTVNISSESTGQTVSTTQQTLFTYKRFQPGQVVVRKEIQDGSTINTEYPFSSSTDLNSEVDSLIGYYGGDRYTMTFPVASNSGLYTKLDDAYESYIALAWKTAATVQTLTQLSASTMMMYKIVSHNVGSETVTFDRKLPNMSSVGSNAFTCFLFSTQSGSTFENTFYDGSYTKTLNSSEAVDSLELLDLENMYAPNTQANGTLQYLGYDAASGKSVVFIQPTYSGWDSVENFKPGTVYVKLPFIMWHTLGASAAYYGSHSTGIEITDDGSGLYRDYNTNLRYGYLKINGTNDTIGKVFYDKKLISIEDQELCACLQYNSNRKYSLQPMLAVQSPTSASTTDMPTGVAYYATYIVSASTLTSDITPLHCRYIQRVVPTISGRTILARSQINGWINTATGYTSNGAIADKLYFLMATGSTSDEYPDPSSWKLTTGKFNGTDQTSLAFFVASSLAFDIQYDPSGPSYDFSSLDISGNTNLTFGDPTLALGYFSATAQSTIYKMGATCVAKNNEFNRTQNDSYSTSLNDSVYITEVALYNENNELLMTGKLNRPIEKNDQKYITVKMEIDL